MKPAMQLPPGVTLAGSLEWDNSTVVPVGRHGMRGRQVLFEFDRQFLLDGVELAPLHLRRRPGVIEIREPVFDNLPGVFADSLPDGWGRLLLDRAAQQQHIQPQTLTPLDRLAHVGRDGIGALVYRSELGADGRQDAIDLDRLADASRAVLDGTSDDCSPVCAPWAGRRRERGPWRWCRSRLTPVA